VLRCAIDPHPGRDEQQNPRDVCGNIPADFKPITTPAPFGGDGFVNLALLRDSGSMPRAGRTACSTISE